MEMEVMIPTAALEFNFDSACTTPYISAPSSPQRFGSFFYSAPTSPTRVSTYELIKDHHPNNSLSSVPFDWEEKPGVPKAKTSVDGDDDFAFAFDFSGQLDVNTSLITADELFDGGKIKPLKPPPGLTTPPTNNKQMIKDALFSPRRRHRKKGDDDLDPFAVALEQTTANKDDCVLQERADADAEGQERGRQRTATNRRNKKLLSGGGGEGRSLSPFRVSDLLLDSEGNGNGNGNGKEVEEDLPPDFSSSSSDQNGDAARRFSTSSLLPSSFVSFWYRRKWKLKDLLLFRSASEGHAMTKEQLNKYAILKQTTGSSSSIIINSEHEQEQQEDHQDVKSSSFRSTDSCASVWSSSSRSSQKAVLSAHELHYRTKRAMAQDLKRKTSLPYKPAGFFGCLGFNPAAAGGGGGGGSSIHDISRNFGASSISREQ